MQNLLTATAPVRLTRTLESKAGLNPGLNHRQENGLGFQSIFEATPPNWSGNGGNTWQSKFTIHDGTNIDTESERFEAIIKLLWKYLQSRVLCAHGKICESSSKKTLHFQLFNSTSYLGSIPHTCATYATSCDFTAV